MAEVSTMILVEGFGIRPRQRIHNSRFQFFQVLLVVFFEVVERVYHVLKSVHVVSVDVPVPQVPITWVLCVANLEKRQNIETMDLSGNLICLINQQTWIKIHIGLPLWTWSTDRHLLQPQDLFQASPSGARTAPGIQFKFFVQFQSILHHCRSKISTQSQSRWCRCRDIWCRNITFTPPAPEGQVGSSL